MPTLAMKKIRHHFCTFSINDQFEVLSFCGTAKSLELLLKLPTLYKRSSKVQIKFSKHSYGKNFRTKRNVLLNFFARKAYSSAYLIYPES